MMRGLTGMPSAVPRIHLPNSAEVIGAKAPHPLPTGEWCRHHEHPPTALRAPPRHHSTLLRTGRSNTSLGTHLALQAPPGHRHQHQMGQTDPEAILSKLQAVVIEAQRLRRLRRFWISARGSALRGLRSAEDGDVIQSGNTAEVYVGSSNSRGAH